MKYFDPGEEGDEVVRSFMLTRGRTRTAAEELAIEALVSAPTATRLNIRSLAPEQRRIVELATSPTSLAEVSALLDIPLRAVIIMASEMVAAGTLVAESTVEIVDSSLLNRIRSAFQAL
jgi:Protein of unknown function (DUF742)